MNFENKEKILELYGLYMDDIYKLTDEKLNIEKENIKLEEKLYSTLNEEQKEILTKINDNTNKKNELTYKNIFVFAYSLANRLMIQSLSDDKTTKKATK